jgi:hypothetical protein
MTNIKIAPDGFLWFKGAKLQVRIVDGGFQFKEKDKFRAQQCGGDLFVVPFDEIIKFIADVTGDSSIELFK